MTPRRPRRRPSRWLTAVASPAVLPVVLGALALTLVYGRFLWQARQGIEAAHAAASRGDQNEATRAYLDALRAYVPGSPFERQALDGLATQAADAARAGDGAGERRVWEAVRAGLLGTRSIYVPYGARLAEAERRLDVLSATPPRFPPDAREIERRGHRPGRTLPPPGAVVAWTLVSLFGFALWVGGIILLIRRGIADVSSLPGGATSVPAGSASAASAPAASAAPTPKFVPSATVIGVLPPLMFVVGFALFLLGLRFT